MHILFYGSECPPCGGGVGAHMLNMAKALCQNGHQATFVTARTDGLPEETIVAGVKIYRRIPARDFRKRESVLWTLSLTRRLGVHWIEGADHRGDCAALLRHRNRPPVVIKVHTCNVLRVGKDSHVHYRWQRPIIELALLRKWPEALAEGFSIQHADLLLAPSHAMVRALQKQKIHRGRRVLVIPNTLSSEVYRPGHEAEIPTMLFVGRIEFGKGIAYLPDIMAGLKKRDVVLEIAGPDTFARGVGSLKTWLRRRLKQVGCTHRFLGRLDAQALAMAYERAWVVVVPSNWDNFPTVVLEAMHHCKAVVASPFGGMSEMLHGTGSCIADPRSENFVAAVRYFIENHKFRRLTGLRMRGRLLTVYTPSQVTRQYVQEVSCALKIEDRVSETVCEN